MRNNIFILVLVILFSKTLVVNSAKILGLFHFPIRSQHVLGSFLLKELAARGHEVTMMSPFPLEEQVENYNDIKVDSGLLNYMKDNFGSNTRGKSMTIIDKLNLGSKNFLAFQQLFLESSEMQELLSSNAQFDLVIVLYNINEAMFGVGHHFNAPSIALCSVGVSFLNNHLFANPAPYSMVPTVYTSSTETFYDRIMNTISGFGWEILLRYKSWPQQRDLLQRIFPKKPALEEVMDNVQIALMNSHPAVEGSKPHMPNQIQIGGFYMKQPEKLPEDLQQFLDGAKEHGAIFFSFGSAVREDAFTDEKLDILIKVFARLEQRVIFKWGVQIQNLPKNVWAGGWLPQTSILNHKNTRLFVTHAGLGGVAECIYYAIPAVCIPFFSDQPKNCDDMVKNGYAVKINHNTLSEEELFAAIKEVLDNPKYKKAVEIASDFYRDQPMDPLDKAIYWVEHVIKHKGASHFPKSIGTRQTLYEYLLLDIAVFTLVIITFAVVMIRTICRIIFGVICNKKKVSKNKKVK